MNEPLLRVRNLTKRFGGVRSVTAVDDVSLEIGRGETLALIGGSGSGKSTLARTILRLVEPDSGTIDFEGKDLLGLAGSALRATRASIQMVFQDSHAAFNPSATVARAIGDPLRIHGIVPRVERGAEIARLLSSVGLPAEFAVRNVHTLSGGQRQRVAIARAIASRPKLIVLDEAVSALDVSIRAAVLDLLAQLQRETGVAYLFVTHDLSIVGRVAHRVAVMDAGRIVEISTPARLLSSPESKAARQLVAAMPRLKYELLKT